MVFKTTSHKNDHVNQLDPNDQENPSFNDQENPSFSQTNHALF
jgi:hypothetical protein